MAKHYNVYVSLTTTEDIGDEISCDEFINHGVLYQGDDEEHANKVFKQLLEGYFDGKNSD